MLSSDILPHNANFTQAEELATWMAATTGVWRCVVWPIAILCMVVIAAYTINGLVHRGAWSHVPGCRSRSFFVRPLTVFLAFVVISMAACSFSLSGAFLILMIFRPRDS